MSVVETGWGDAGASSKPLTPNKHVERNSRAYTHSVYADGRCCSHCSVLEAPSMLSEVGLRE